MKVKNIRGKTVEYYTTVEEIPIGRYHKFQKYLLLESNIGDTKDGIDLHLDKLASLIRNNKNDKALTEIFNLSTQLNIIEQEISFKSLAFAALVRKINGEFFDAKTDESIQKISDKLNAPVGIINNIIAEVKKKLMRR